MAFPSTYPNRVPIVVQNGKVAVDETDYILLLTHDNLPDECLDADGDNPAKNGGGDIAFSTDLAGATRIACDVIRFEINNTPANARAQIKVLVPNIYSATDATIYMWWGDAGASQPAEDATYGQEATYPTAIKASFPYDDIPDNTAGNIKDRTANDNDGQSSGMSSADSQDVQVNKGIDFDGSVNYINHGSRVSIDNIFAGGGSLCFWMVKDTNGEGDAGRPFHKGDNASNNNGWSIQHSSDDAFFWRRDFSTTTGIWKTNTNVLADASKHHVVITYDEDSDTNDPTIYVDGSPITVNDFTVPSGTANSDAGNNLTVGNWGITTTRCFNGKMDDIYLIDGELSANQVLTRYNNDNDPATFAIAGTVTTESPDDFARQGSLTIDNTKVASNQTNFALLITQTNIVQEAIDKDGSFPADDGGGDLRFYSDEAGTTRLACQIREFTTNNDPALATVDIRVNVPSVSSTVDTKIWMRYGNSGATQPVRTSTYGGDNAWNSDYVMVQSMNQDPSGSAPQMIDDTGNGNDGTSQGTMLTADVVDGQIFKGLDFDGVDDYIDVPDDASLDVTTSLTMKLWVEFDSVTVSQIILGKYDTQNSQLSFWMNSNTLGELRCGMSSTGLAQSSDMELFDTTSANLAINTKYQVVGVWGGSGWTLYLNGVSKTGTTTGAETTIYTGTSPVFIGAGRSTSGMVLHSDATIDEVQILNTSFSANDVTTHYNNEASPATFVTAGTGESTDATTEENAIFMGCNF